MFSPTILPLLFPFTTFIFPKFIFNHFPFPYIIYSTFSIILIVSPVLLFQCLLFRLPHIISSNQFPVVFPVCRSSHCSNSWLVISLVFFLPDFTFPVFLSSWLFFCFLFPIFYGLVSYFPNSVSLTSLIPCTLTVQFQIFCLFVLSSLLLFQFLFFLSIVSEFPYHLSILSILFKMQSFPNAPQISKSCSHSISHLSYMLFVSRRCVFLALFLLGFRIGTRDHSIGHSRSFSLLFPLASNFLYCQSSLTFPSTSYFPKLQFIYFFDLHFIEKYPKFSPYLKLI